jgi:hypothetical protein
MPAAGWLFVLLLVLAPVLLVVGAWMGLKAVLLVGLIAAGFLVLLLLLGAAC